MTLTNQQDGTDSGAEATPVTDDEAVIGPTLIGSGS